MTVHHSKGVATEAENSNHVAAAAIRDEIFALAGA